MSRLDRGPAGKIPAPGSLGFVHTPTAPQPPNQPFLNELTGNRPDTGARQDVSVRYTQLQPIVCLFQLLDHLLYKLDVAGAVADKGIKSLRHLPWVQSTGGGGQSSVGRLGVTLVLDPTSTLR